MQPSTLPPFSWTSWSGDGVLRAGLLLLAGVYLLGVGPLRRRYRLGPPVGRGRIATYLSGVLCLLIALEGPIHELSDKYLFSAHMVQHMLLIYAAPPLMLLGTPAWLLRPVLRLPGLLPVAELLTKPIPALILFNVVFSVYHVPLYYNAVVSDHNLHIAAHLLFIVLAVITWWPILSPLPELPPLSYPLRMLYVFGQTFSGFIVGSFITNSPTLLYPFYADAPRVWGLDAAGRSEDRRAHHVGDRRDVPAAGVQRGLLRLGARRGRPRRRRDADPPPTAASCRRTGPRRAAGLRDVGDGGGEWHAEHVGHAEPGAAPGRRLADGPRGTPRRHLGAGSLPPELTTAGSRTVNVEPWP